ncbi:MAG TPA: phosphate ABC transporter substrate-binding protein PstS [Pseudonocardiaceae bacterium]
MAIVGGCRVLDVRFLIPRVRTIRRWAVVGTALLAVVVGSPVAAAANYVPINGAGSTWSSNAINAWRVNVAQFGIPVNYTAVGSTTGRNEFRDGTVDWAASDIPYGLADGTNVDPPPMRGFAYLPDTAGGLSFMYNLTIGTRRVTNLRLSGPAIAGIFTGTITRWNDPAITADNPGLSLPAIRIVPVVRSDGAGATSQFTQWMVATQGPAWTAYCQAVGRSPCTQTAAYPVLPGSAMVAQAGDLGVAGFVSQSQAAGSIGFVEYSYALQTGFPVAKMLNAAGYYTAPTAGHVAVSLLKAQTNSNLTEDLSQVYTNPDPRTYPLSGYSYLIVPTATDARFTTAKGFTLADFGKYLLCQGQNQVDALGYSALPINLVQAGFDQLRRIPGANIPNINLSTCDNPTFSTDGTNTLANTDPFPPACDKQGTTQCNGDATPPGTGQETIQVGLGAVSSGSLTLTVSGTPVTMSTPTDIGTALDSTGSLSPVTVSDSRLPGEPGWDATGSVGDFTSGANTFSGNALGWTPAITTPDAANDVTSGGTVAPNNPGLGTTAALAAALAGHGAGTTVLGAGLDLRIPLGTPAGNYSATLTVTLLSK